MTVSRVIFEKAGSRARKREWRCHGALAAALGVLLVLSSAARGEVGEISIAVVCGEQGHAAAAQAYMAGDLAGTIDRIDASTFNSMTVEELRSVYDVLIFAWGANAEEDADWETRLLPFLRLGGGILFEDSGNVSDLAPGVIGTEVNSSGGVHVSAAVPGLTDGIVNDPGGFVDWHMAFTMWDPRLRAFLGTDGLTIGLYGEIEGGRIVLTGTDQEFHAQFEGAGAQGNQYQLLLNEIRWVARLGEEERPCLSGDCDLDYFKCYRARRARGASRDVEAAGTEPVEPAAVTEPPAVSILDQFGARDATLLRPYSVCNAVSKDGVQMKDGAAQLVCYRTREHRRDPRQESADMMPQLVEVQNEFGAQSVKLTSAYLLCVPARASEADLAAASASPMQCYKARGATPEKIPVILRDRFGTTLARVSKPVTTCGNATIEAGALEVAKGSGLHCHRIVKDKGQENLVPRTIEVVSSLGTETLRVTRPYALCLPSSLGDGQ